MVFPLSPRSEWPIPPVESGLPSLQERISRSETNRRYPIFKWNRPSILETRDVVLAVEFNVHEGARS